MYSAVLWDGRFGGAGCSRAIKSGKVTRAAVSLPTNDERISIIIMCSFTTDLS